MGDDVQLWLVERTFSDDEQNLIILIYATVDGRYYHRKERALTSFSGPGRETTASITVPKDRLGSVSDPNRREAYASEASRMAAEHEPDEAV